MVKKPQFRSSNRDYLLTPSEAANALRVSRTTLYTLVQRGELIAVHIGRSLRFRPEDLRACVERLAAGLSADPQGETVQPG